MDKQLKELVGKLKDAHRERLTSVILYGSAAGGDHHKHYSDVNVLCVLDQITPSELAASEPVFRWWREAGNPAPLLLTEYEVQHSTDCFPVEFQDMKERRRVLFGKDVIEQLAIDRSFYRAQVEHELRSKMIRLRQQAAGLLPKPEALLQLCAESVSTFLVLARHALLLAGVAAKWQKRSVVEQLAEQLGVDRQPFDTLLSLREQSKKPRDVDAGRLFEQYLIQIQRVVDFVDRLEK